MTKHSLHLLVYLAVCYSIIIPYIRYILLCFYSHKRTFFGHPVSKHESIVVIQLEVCCELDQDRVSTAGYCIFGPGVSTPGFQWPVKVPWTCQKKYFTLSLWTQMQLQFMKNKNKYLFT